MPEETSAGSILVELKAQVESLQKGFAQAKATLNEFGKGVQGAATGVEKAGEKITGGFGAIDRSQLQLTAKLARFTQRMIGLQLLMSQLGSSVQGGSKAFQAGIQAMTSGLTVFASVVSLAPNPIGILIGALGGLAAAFKIVANSEAEATERMKKFLQVVNLRTAKGLAGGDVAAIGSTGEENVQRRLKEAEAAAEVINTQLRLRQIELDRLELDRIERTKKLLEERQKLQAVLAQARVAGADPEVTLRNLDKIEQELDQIAKAAVTKLPALREGLAASRAEAEAAEKRIRELQEALESVRSTQKAMESLDTIIEADREFESTRAGREAEARILRDKELLDFRRAIEDRDRELDQQFQADQRDQFGQNVAEPFGAAIGHAVFRGIMEGKKAMEILADVGENLFSNFIDQSVRQFQAGMTDAFVSVFGTAAQGLGQLFTAVAGIAGAIYARRHGGGSDSFAAIRSQVESSQSVRGIVAGPSNVAIAAVGENISRAFEPARQLLEGILRAVVSIDRKTGRSAPGAASLGWAGTVPTV